jgi:hypothetical protein
MSQDLELKLEWLATSDTTSHPHNYLAKSEHVRLLEARLATQAAEFEAELLRKLNEARKEVLLKVIPHLLHVTKLKWGG